MRTYLFLTNQITRSTLFFLTVKTGVPDILLLKTGVQADPKEKGNYTGVLRIRTEDIRENLKTRSSPPSSSSSSKKNAGAKLQQRLRGTSHLETKHRRDRRRGRAAVERQPYCLWVRRDDKETANNRRRGAPSSRPPLLETETCTPSSHLRSTLFGNCLKLN
jgi:hypothetical protein